jgi:hypothetical protein
MYKRPHHQRIAAVLDRLNADLLRDAACYFAGGTAIAMQLGEYRESVDIDFLCATQDGYRTLRSLVFEQGIKVLFNGPVDLLREVRSDQYGIRCFLTESGAPIKFEIVREARIDLTGQEVDGIPVTCLSRNDLFAEKLLANADRWADKGALSRDIIDLMMMERHWGSIPAAAWDKARSAYGDSVERAWENARQQLRDDPRHFASCVERMGIDQVAARELDEALAA